MVMWIIASNEKRKMTTANYYLLFAHRPPDAFVFFFLFMFVQKLYFNSIMFNVHLNIKRGLQFPICYFSEISAEARFINKEERLPIIDCYYFSNRSSQCCCCCCCSSFSIASSAHFCRMDWNGWKWIYSYAITANHIDQFQSMKNMLLTRLNFLM